MPRSSLTGSRIRARRLDLGLRQTELARACGISASYLNLIEHNRRRIGGKLLVDIARRLEVEVGALSQGADQSLIEELRLAAENAGLPEAADAAEELAGRLPESARLVAEQARRIAELESALETLSDRLAHDPFLAESLHDVLTSAAAIRSTSAILAEEEVDPAWQARFHRNLHEDSRRLAEASRSLASYLEAGGDTSKTVLSPQEEFHSWLERLDFRLDWIEEGAGSAEDPRRIASAEELGSVAAQMLATAHAARYRRDAIGMPEDQVVQLLQENGPDPSRLAAVFGADFPAVFRRIAALSGRAGLPSIGLAICDGAGALTLRKPAEGFPLPLFGSACPLWPLYQALARPSVPIRRTLELEGRTRRRFDSFTFAEAHAIEGFDGPVMTISHMLILPRHGADDAPAASVGTSCRICPRRDCPARREPCVIGVGPAAVSAFDRP